MIKFLSRYSVSLFISLVITWGIGLLVIVSNQYIENLWAIWFYGLFNSLLAVGLFHLLLSPIALFKKKYKVASVLIHIIYCAVLLIEVLSLFYFSITLKLLGRTIFEFSMDQSMLIIKSFFVFKWYYLLIPFPWGIYFFLNRINVLNRINYINKKVVFYTLFCIGILSIFIGFQTEPKHGFYSDLSKNKTIYFIQSIYNTPTSSVKVLSQKDIAFYQEATNPNLKNKKYPLYRPTYNANPLSSFFNLKETPPNIEIIVVESLSSSFSGSEADEISYTPFLDSLGQHSLYFTNFLATAERTFAALPSILGSLPHGKKGYASNKTGYPRSQTLPSWLFDNGYTGDFHYGGYARFDYMDLFMNDQGFKNIYDQKEYNYEGTGLQTSIDSIPFGIQDKKLFEKVIRKQRLRKTKGPYLDICLTLSMHYPYMIENHEDYYDKVEDIIKNAKVNQKLKDKHKKYIKEFATFLYTDNALKWYFKQQKKAPFYDNTIYVIVGDHMMGEIAQNNQIEKYRPVLMIYSPLLKRDKIIKGANSHLDITPSLYQLLKNQYGFSNLDSVSWLGQPFDTSAVFQCNRDVLFMLNNRTVNDILHNKYFLTKDKLYTVGDHFHLTPSKNKEKLEYMKRLRTVSITMHKDVVAKNLLVPPVNNLKLLDQKSKSLKIDNTLEYIDIYKSHVSLPYKKILFNMNIEFSGDWAAEDKEENNPILVYVLKRGDSILNRNYIHIHVNKEKKKEQNFYFIISSNLDYNIQPGDKIQIYFWNKNKKYSNLVADIKSLTIKGEP